nr:hypothetical protein BaRGS_034953 [Batillaria attramentaria]
MGNVLETDPISSVKQTDIKAGERRFSFTHNSITGRGIMSFKITGVLPGEYDIKATHPKWKFQKAETRVKVVDDNVNAGTSLTVAGYDVKGQVFSEGEPMKGVNFVLFSKSGKQQVPFYKGDHITFDVEPEKLEFEVHHDSVVFEGMGIAKATVQINGQAQTTTDATGTYHLENMKTGSYVLSVTADNIFFPDSTVKITPNTPQLPDIVASGFNACGKVTIDRVPESLGAVTSQRRIIYYPEGKGSEAVSIATDAAGKFCVKVTPGKYVFKVHLSDQEVKAGLHLAPSQRTAAITNKPVLDVNFSQFRAKVSGTITCMEKCGDIEVSLDAVGRTDAKVVVKAKDSGEGANFQFENILPGKYKGSHGGYCLSSFFPATIIQDSWCWKNKSVELENFAHEKKTGTVGSFQLNKGTNRFCLAQAGVYQLTPDSCHKFEQEVYTYDTSSPVALTLTAIQHLATGTVKTEEKVTDIVVTIKSVTSSSAAGAGKDSKEKGPFIYAFSHWARSGERLEISVKSKEVLFYPAKKEVLVDGGEVASFVGRKGVFITGQVKPPLEGVQITVTAEDGSMEPVVLTTEASGKYRVGPLHSDVKYSVAAEKPGYVITKDKDASDVFRAFKLGEISVKFKLGMPEWRATIIWGKDSCTMDFKSTYTLVVDKENQPMPSVLLSLSGERQYRSNNITGETGALVFTSLYFLRPMMKEYKFEPTSQTIEVKEGTTIDITISGIRIAYSCYGRVTSLNGEPEPGVIVEAVGQGAGCEGFQEAKTEQDGSYRIRGLEPKCQYDVHLKTGQVNTHIERSGPKSRLVQVVDKDFTDVNIIAFRRMNQMDISGNVITPSEEFYASVKAQLYREDSPDSPVHSISLARSPFFYFPTLQMDNTRYTLRIECSLPKSQYEYVDQEITFTANISFKHYTFRFEPKRKLVDQELTPGSFLILPVVGLVVLAVYNYQTLLPFLMQLVGQVQAFAQHQQQQQQQQRQASDNDTYMEPSSAESSPVKKRNKPRKAQ